MGLINLFVLFQIIVMLFGLYWVHEVLQRLGDDVAIIRAGEDRIRAFFAIAMWIVTLGVAALTLWLAVRIGTGLVQGLIEFFG